LTGEAEAASGWTVGTLREHFAMQHEALTRQLAADRDALNGKITDSREYARLQVTDQQAAHRQQIADMRALLDERYATQTKALDAAFKAAEQAVAVALANAEKATAKAELAANARFESVNEFRKALSDQTATFIPRAEYDTAHTALGERVSSLSDRLVALELRLTSRLDRGEGSEAGASGQRSETRLNVGAVIGVALFLLSVVTFVILYATKK
jgi:uncharacterized tellurite resistance protein B-like protein